jgi:hypothetical protein
MKAQEQVTSIDPSKKLKQLGVKQDSLFYLGEQFNPVPTRKNRIKLFTENEANRLDDEDWTIYSAFTLSELGERIKNVRPANIYAAYNACGGTDEGMGQFALQVLDVNFLADMLIYLIENNYITPNNLL